MCKNNTVIFFVARVDCTQPVMPESWDKCLPSPWPTVVSHFANNLRCWNPSVWDVAEVGSQFWVKLKNRCCASFVSRCTVESFIKLETVFEKNWKTNFKDSPTFVKKSFFSIVPHYTTWKNYLITLVSKKIKQ